MSEESGPLAFYILLASMTVAMIWELAWPRRAEGKGLAFRWANNFSLALVNQVVLHAGRALVLIITAKLAHIYGGGLLLDTTLPVVAVFLVTLLCLDFTGYLLHIAMHKTPWLWRFHALHHSDPELDFSSSYRHHPVESIITYLVSIPVVAILAPPVGVLAAYQGLRIFLVIWGHANVYLPPSVDRFLRLFLITPDFHRLHHCSEQRFTDSNYGTISPWFDYLFKTASYRPFDEQRSMELGLENYRDPMDSRLDKMLLLPLRVAASQRSQNPELTGVAESATHCKTKKHPVD